MEVETSYYQQLLEQYLKKAVDDGASDLFIIAGGKVSYKVDGAIQDLSEEKVFPDQTKELIQALYAMAGSDMRKYQTDGDDDFSFAKAGLARFRVNAFRQRGSLAAVIRIVQFDIPDYRDLQIPEEVMKIAKEQHGMVIIPERPVAENPRHRRVSLTRSIRNAQHMSSRWRIRSSICTAIISL